MYTCERCGTRFGRVPALFDSCPRCLAREGVRVGLEFRLREDGEVRPADGETSSAPRAPFDGASLAAVIPSRSDSALSSGPPSRG